MEIDLSEYKDLANLFQDDLIKRKAEELGVKPSDIMPRVVNGKIVFVKKADVLAKLEEQRRLVTSEKPVRSLRDKENSLVSLIKEDLRECQRLIEELGNKNLLSSTEKYENETFQKNINTRIDCYANDLARVEERIEQVKKHNPIFAQAEVVLGQIMKARENNNAMVANAIAFDNQELLKEYQFRRRILNPHILEARKFRCDLQKDYWEIMQRHYYLQRLDIDQYQLLLVAVEQDIESDKKREVFQRELVIVQIQYEQLLEQLKNDQNLLSPIPSPNMDSAKAMKILDGKTAAMRYVIDRQTFFCNEFRSLIAKFRETPQPLETPVSSSLKTPLDTAPVDQPGNQGKRMAYQKRSRK